MLTTDVCDSRFLLKLYPVKPYVYDDALSYLEMVRGLCEKVNEIIDQQSEWLDQAIAYTDEQINALRTDLYNQFQQVKDQVQYIQGRLDEIAADNVKIHEEVKALNARLDGILASIQGLEDVLKAYTDNKILIEHQWVENEIKKIYDYIDKLSSDWPVWNMFQNKVTTLQELIQDFYDCARIGAITAGEFDRAKITAEQFDNYRLTACKFDFNAKNILFTKTIRSAFTGEMLTVEQAYFELVNKCCKTNALTATEFDTIAITATEFDTLAVTAYNFDWDGKTAVHK